MSDWDIVKGYIMNKGFEPKYTSLDEIIEAILLYWDEASCEETEDWNLTNFLNDVVRDDIQSYDYE